MKTRRVLRYYCDFCKKSGCSKYHMAKHEKHCTMNPDRECRVCGMLKQEQADIKELITTLPNPSDYGYPDDSEHPDSEYPSIMLHKAIGKAYPHLREAANDCPACTLAALRQAKIPMYMVQEFDFKAEMKEIWNKINSAAADEEDYR